MSVEVDAFVGELVEACEKYTDEVVEKLQKGILKTAKEAQKELAQNLAPKKTGDYRKKFIVTENKVVRGQKYKGRVYAGSKPYTVTIWNKNFRLIHLLEYGHLNCDGTTRSRATLHMKRAEELTEKKIEKLLKELN